ncbi:MAG TPA: site-specific integrase, partial [Lachnospiraceae bacterium]|nr:site-specific integrase [Lachnospiraceae bacterium]
MPRRGENIRKRADGRWEGRYKCVSAASGTKSYYKSIYGKSYGEVKQKLLLIRQETQINIAKYNMEYTFSECMTLWLADITQRCKYSTCVKYQYI